MLKFLLAGTSWNWLVWAQGWLSQLSMFYLLHLFVLPHIYAGYFLEGHQ